MTRSLARWHMGRGNITHTLTDPLVLHEPDW